MIAEMMMRSKFRRILLAGSAAFTVTVMPAATALAQAQVTPSATQVRVDIPAGSLSEALIALGQQADVQIAFLPDRVVGRRVKALKGTMTTEQALQRLLSGTLLRYRSLRPGSYVVGGPTDANVREARKIADEASAGSGFVNGKVGIPEILVIGRRTMTINTDIPRTENEAQPYTVFTSEEIKRSGSVNLEDFFRDNLGQNVSVRTALQGGGVTGRDSQINLRGLGLDATLILVDGRRFAEPNNGITGAFTQSSLAGIPLEQIERIEVLASSAAGQYGSNAVGGVINIILKRDFKGVELNSYLGSSTRGDAREYRLSANATVPILPGTSLSLSANWKKSDPLFGADRQFLNERLDFILANNPNFLNTTTQLIYGSTPNIRSANGGNLVLKSQYAVNGVTALNSPVTFIPTGYPGIATAGAAALLQNAGKQNSDPSPSIAGGLVVGDRTRLLSGSEGWGGTATFRSDPTDWLAIYGSASFSRFMTTFDALAVPDTVSLPANSPNNPFVGAVQVSFPTLNGFGQREARSDTIQAIGGAIVSLPWKWKAYFDVNQSWGRASVDDTGRQLTANYFRNLTELGLVNVLVDTIANPIDFQFDPDRMGTVRPPSKSEFNSYTLKFAGPLDFAKLPGGVPVVTLVAEQSRQWFGDSVVYVDGPSNAVVSYSPERSQKNRSAYGELVMPIIGPANNIPFINQFELHLAGRYDSYKGRGTNSSFTCVNHTGNLTAAELASPCPAPGVKIPYRTVKNDTFNPVIAAKWNIFPDLALRGSYSTGYTPPFLNNVLETPGIAVLGYTSAVVVSALDPLRNNERIGNSLLGSQTYLIEGLSGGNPNVDPQRSTSWSFGTILEPQRIPGLTLRADWTRITINNAYFSPSSLLTRTTPEERASFNDFMAAYPERFVRAAPGPGETVGKIIYIDATTANLSYKRSESLDFSADLITQVAGGTLRVHGNLSYLLKLESRLTPSAKTQNLKGVVSTADIFGLGDSLEYRGNANVNYSRNDWSLGGAVRYFGGYYVNANRSVSANQGAARVSGQALFDVFGSWKIFKATTIAGGIRNIFDKRPPIDVTRTTGYAPYGDPRLRSFYLSINQRL